MDPQLRRSVVPWILSLALCLMMLAGGGCSMDLGDAPFKCNPGNPKCPDGYDCKYGACVREGTCPYPTVVGCPPPPDGGGSNNKAPRGKFCNGLQNTDGSKMTMLLKVGNANMFALTGQCSACQNLPAGKQEISLWLKGAATESAKGSITLQGGKEYIFLSSLDKDNLATVEGGELKPTYKGATVDPFKSQ